MQGFKEYLIDEFKDRAKGFAAVEFRFGHNVNIKQDKLTKTPLKVDIIKVSIRFVDKDMCTLYTTSISFENNVIPKTKHKQFVNIAPKELENKFNYAKNEIIQTIMTEYIIKRDDLNDKINNLQTYSGNNNDIIKPLFKGDVVNVVDNQTNERKVKFQFDM